MGQTVRQTVSCRCSALRPELATRGDPATAQPDCSHNLIARTSSASNCQRRKRSIDSRSRCNTPNQRLNQPITRECDFKWDLFTQTASVINSRKSDDFSATARHSKPPLVNRLLRVNQSESSHTGCCECLRRIPTTNLSHFRCRGFGSV